MVPAGVAVARSWESRLIPREHLLDLVETLAAMHRQSRGRSVSEDQLEVRLHALKRLERALDRETLAGRLREMLRAAAPDPDATAAAEIRLADVTKKIGRLVDALAGGSGHLPSVRARLGELEGDRRSLETEARQAGARAAPSPENLEATIDSLIEALGRLPDILVSFFRIIPPGCSETFRHPGGSRLDFLRYQCRREQVLSG